MRTNIFTAALALGLATTPLFAETAKLTEGYARTAYTGAPSGAAFLVIENPGTDPLQLIEARSDAAARVELHTHIADGEGVMRMREVEGGFTIPAGGTFAMQRGGDHVMFMGVTDPWESGDMLDVVLIFDNGTELPISVPVHVGNEAGQDEHKGHMSGDDDGSAMDADD